jgi:outer membrane immunogenic protein
VLGTELEWNWTGLNGSGGGVSTPNAAATAFCILVDVFPCVSPVGDAFTSHTNWYATATARLGIAHDRWLFYTKVGAAFDHNNYTHNISGTFFPALFPSPFAAAGTASDYRAGLTVGLGLEWAFAGNWSAKIEYDYMNFGSRTVTFNDIAVVRSFFPPTLVSSTPVSVNIYQQMSVVKLGINYRFLPSI